MGTQSPGPTPRGARSRSGWAARTVVGVLLLAAVCALAFYWQDLVGAVQLRVWAKGEAIAAAQSFVDALRNNDVDTVRSLCADDQDIPVEDGRIVSLQRAGTQGKPTMRDDLVAAPDTDYTVEYDLAPKRRCARVRYTAESGSRAALMLVRQGGRWLVRAHSAIGQG